jgi:putative colanic acid biosynthesis glycosyltransferase WcaI
MKVLLLNQCFWPDVMATGLQLTDVACELAERGHEVTVITGRRGYDDPKLLFPRHERRRNIEIFRMRSIAAGKTSRWRRALNFASFLAACAFRLAFTRQQDVVLALTSPPLISWLASLFTRLKGGRLVFWVMDLNPDEAIAAGWLRAESATAKLLAKLLLSSMQHAEKIIVLDRFMKERLLLKGIASERVEVISPWSQDEVHYDPQSREAFRRVHSLTDKFVIMYAGNHSPCHPLDTLLEAAAQLAPREELAFCFVGGGSEQRKVREFASANQLKNIHCLPYQRQEDLSGVLSAADLHMIVMGEAFAGIVHPCKIYNVLTIGTPFLYVGPRESHMGDIIARLNDPRRAMQSVHGRPEAVGQLISDAATRQNADNRIEVHQPAVRSGHLDLAASFSKTNLLPKFIKEVEAVGSRPGTSTTETPAAKFQSA